jgi:hypothetical protein
MENSVNYKSYHTKIIVLVAIFFALLFLSSCSRPKYNKSTSTNVKIDSVFIKQIDRVEVLIKDTVITTQLDSVLVVLDTLFLDKDCPTVKDKSIERYSNSGNTKATISLKNGLLSVRCDSDSLKIVVTNLRQIISYKENELSKAKLSATTITVEKPVPKIKYKVPVWAWICLAYTLASLIYIFRNPIISLVKKN